MVDVNRARMLYRVARETKSAALEADAAHFASDIWSSLAVLTGLCCVALAPMAEAGSWQHWLLMNDTLHIPKPITPPSGGGGGFKPGVSDWDEEQKDIEI